MAERLGYRPELDGLRALAVAAVLGYHLQAWSWLEGGYVGVDVFFVLSGFLITTLIAESHDADRWSVRDFYLRRVARLAPALLVLVAVVVPVYVLIEPEGHDMTVNTTWGGLAALTYVTAWWRAFTVNELGRLGHAWSLSVEEWFYVLWPLVFAWLWTKDRTRLVWRLLVLTAVVALYGLVGFAAGYSSRRLYNGPDVRMAQILVGCLLAVIIRRYRGHWTVSVAAVVGSVFLIGFVVAGPDPYGPFYEAGGSIAVAVASAMVMWHLFIRGDGPAARALRARPVVWVGRRSYGIYLWHWPIYGFVFAELTMPRSRLIVIALTATFVVAALSYRFVEVPARRRLRSGAGVVEQEVAAAELRE